MSHTVKIEGMKCDGCTKKVTEKFSSVPGVSNVEVSLENKEAVLDGDVTLELLNGVLTDTHFKAVSII